MYFMFGDVKEAAGQEGQDWRAPGSPEEAEKKSGSLTFDSLMSNQKAAQTVADEAGAALKGARDRFAAGDPFEAWRTGEEKFGDEIKRGQEADTELKKAQEELVALESLVGGEVPKNLEAAIGAIYGAIQSKDSDFLAANGAAIEKAVIGAFNARARYIAGESGSTSPLHDRKRQMAGARQYSDLQSIVADEQEHVAIAYDKRYTLEDCAEVRIAKVLLALKKANES